MSPVHTNLEMQHIYKDKYSYLMTVQSKMLARPLGKSVGLPTLPPRESIKTADDNFLVL